MVVIMQKMYFYCFSDVQKILFLAGNDIAQTFFFLFCTVKLALLLYTVIPSNVKRKLLLYVTFY